MSKNTNISELINYISVNGSGDIVMTGNLIMPGGAQAATQTYVTTAISNLVASSPATLDTLNELATALGNDANFATTVATSIGTKQAQLNGTGFVKISGTTISYDNSTYLTSITSSNVTTALGYTPYNNTNPSGYITSSALSSYLPLAGGTLSATNTTETLRISNGGSGYAIYVQSDAYFQGDLKLQGSLKSPSYTFTLPSATGTLALTSDLSSYLPLAGGTLTGGLNGTSASFSGAISLINTLNLYKTGGTTLGGQLAYDSAVNQLYLWNNVSSGYFSIYTNSTERLTILPGGNVGLGTNSPIKNLQVYASNGSGIGIGRNLTDNNFSANLFFYPSSLSSEKRNWAITTYYGAAGLMEFRRSTTTTADPYDSGVTVMSLDSVTDFVGIGTASPTAKLHIKGNNARIRLTGDTYTSIEIEDGGTGDPGYIRTYDYGSAVCQIGAGGTYFNTGNVGIGLSNPQAILDVSHTAGTTNIIRVSNGSGNYRWRVDQNFSMVMTNASGIDTYSVNTFGGSIQKDTCEVKRSGDGDLFIGRYSSGSAKLVYAYQSSADGYLELRTGADTIVTKLSGYTGTPAYMNTKLTVGGTTTYSLSTLNVEGAIKANRSIYNWYQESYVGNSTYLHIKTNMWCGGSPYGNSDYTMSLFKGYMYAYGTPPALEGTIVFHNWDGNFYNIGTTGNLFVTAYRSTDGYVVLVTNSGSGEAGLTIDWHQAYGYPFRDRIKTASKLHGATTGGY